MQRVDLDEFLELMKDHTSVQFNFMNVKFKLPEEDGDYYAILYDKYDDEKELYIAQVWFNQGKWRTIYGEEVVAWLDTNYVYVNH